MHRPKGSRREMPRGQTCLSGLAADELPLEGACDGGVLLLDASGTPVGWGGG